MSYKEQNDRLREYRSWYYMIQRCYSPKSARYYLYGARGITVCERWRGNDGYKHFLEDMGLKPGKEYTLDRIDNEKGYSPDNCRWADPLTQANNKRRTRWVEYQGKRYPVRQLIRQLGFEHRAETYIRRLKVGWSAEEAFNTPIDTRHDKLNHRR